MASTAWRAASADSNPSLSSAKAARASASSGGSGRPMSVVSRPRSPARTWAGPPLRWMAGKPIIGISAFPRLVDTSIGRTLLHTASRFYVDSVVRAGGVPVVLPVIDPADIGPMIAAIDGLVITGGGDVQPSRSGAKPGPRTP